MEDITFDFAAATSTIVEWDGLDEEHYCQTYKLAYGLGVDVVAYVNAGGGQRAFVRGMGYDDKKSAGMVTKVRRAYVVATTAPRVIAAYEKATQEGDRSIFGLVSYIDGLNSTSTTTSTLADKVVKAAKGKTVKEIQAAIKALEQLLADAKVK